MAYREYFTPKDAREAQVSITNVTSHSTRTEAIAAAREAVVVISQGVSPSASRFLRSGQANSRQRDNAVDINEVNSAFDKAMKKHG